MAVSKSKNLMDAFYFLILSGKVISLQARQSK
jgi:hypothetical protein